MHERAADTFTAPGDDLDQSLAVGALTQPSTMDNPAAQAGYRVTQTLPIDHPVWRFYRLLP